MPTRLTPSELAAAVHAHALEHYTDGGWDVVYECWTLAEIQEHIVGATTVRGALSKFARLVAVWADQEADAINSAF